MKYPKIYLAIDNCFASKRWTEPKQWMEVIKGLGVMYVEASADNECDPLYMGDDYMAAWVNEVREAEQRTGVKVANLYSGHGTYATLGLGHTDVRVRERILRQWLMPMRKVAGQLDAGLGFYCHAFAESVLQDTAGYKAKCGELYDQLAELSACEAGGRSIGVEQMYSPHQIPWTIAGAKELLREVYGRGGAPMYLTIDTGHHIGQRKFLRPSGKVIAEALEQAGDGKRRRGLWLGPSEAYDIFDKYTDKQGGDAGDTVKRIEEVMARYPHLFALESDGDPYRWLGELGCYSPIIHLQQSDGNSSSHWAFTKEFNEKGVIEGEKVLRAVCKAYGRDADLAMPPAVEEIYMTLELFSATADNPADIISRLEETVEYWRRFIPSDGERLDKIAQRLG